MIAVTVLGTPVPQGSMRALGPGRMKHSNAEKLRPWRDAVAWHVREECLAQGLSEPLDGPVAVAASFTLARPKSAPKVRWAPDRKPDIDKLARGLLDAIVAGGAITDDAQVVDLRVAKVYPVDGNLPGVTFTVAPAERGEAVAA
ncbi:MAG: RusA family crossover junction endodeoxyribonuclease [Blastococcus sp.]